MMIVMPTFPEPQQPYHPLIVTPVLRLKRPFTEGMADRVDAPGDMMGQEDAYQAPPEQACPATQGKGNHQTQHRPEQEGPADEDDHLVFHQMGAIVVGITLVIAEHPADVRVKEAINRTVRVALTVGEGMMLEMRCCPLKRRSLDGHGAKDEQQTLDDRMGSETPMGQHPMVANSHAKGDQSIHNE